MIDIDSVISYQEVLRWETSECLSVRTLRDAQSRRRRGNTSCTPRIVGRGLRQTLANETTVSAKNEGQRMQPHTPDDSRGKPGQGID